jgi:hypothetical protein
MYFFAKSLEYNIRSTGKNPSETISEYYRFLFFLSNKDSICRVKLCDRPTICSDEFSQFHREGFILSLTLEDGSIGYGEVE